MEYIFKKIESQDLSALTDFFAKNQGTEFFDPFPLNAESAMYIATKDKINFYFGIFYSERIIGFGMLRWYKNYQSPTLGLLVDKNHRGEGLGTKIYEYLFKIAKERKCPEIIAIVHKKNIASTHIAKKLGMKEIDRENLCAENHYDFSEYIKNNSEKLVLIKKLIPKLSVCIITYNHEKYISDTINGVLTQNTDFDYEIVIGEDCSTDNTRSIIIEYANKFPGKFRLLLPKNNLGMMKNFIATLMACTGEYIALCEGDDYWTDPDKLQKQIDFLDKNPNYNICSHNANIFTDEKFVKIYCRSNHPETMDLKYLLAYGSGCPTCSLVFRNKAIKNLPDWFYKIRGGDWGIQIVAAQYGKMKYFNEIMGVYRRHNQGALYAINKEAKSRGESDFCLPSNIPLK